MLDFSWRCVHSSLGRANIYDSYKITKKFPNQFKLKYICAHWMLFHQLR
jgi:hypothetical protein